MQRWTVNATSQWTRATTNQFDEMNQWIQATELDLNNHAFGMIKDSAITINDTLTNVVNQVQDLIQTVLGGTLLETPAKELTQCLLLTKIENIEQGLTWIVSLLL
jgi:prophage DNA circulation protein